VARRATEMPGSSRARSAAVHTRADEFSGSRYVARRPDAYPVSNSSA
jgi:hypothetical protein